MKCPKCHTENPDAQKYCGECGHKLISSSIQSPEALSFDEKIDKIQRYLPKGLTDKILSQKDQLYFIRIQ